MQQVDVYSIEKLVTTLKNANSSQEIHAILESTLLHSGHLAELIKLPDELIVKVEQEALRLFGQEVYQEARSYFQFLATSRPGFAMYWIYLGAACMKLELYEEALRSYGIATTVAPDDPRPYFFSAYSYSQLKKNDQAKLCLHQVIDLCKGSREWHKLEQEAVQFLYQINEGE